MRRSSWIMQIVVVAALLGLASVASADTLTTYTLMGTTLDDPGGDLTGQFTYDSTSQSVNEGFSNVQILYVDPDNFGPQSPISQAFVTGTPTSITVGGFQGTISLTFATPLTGAPQTDAIISAVNFCSDCDVTPNIALGSIVAPSSVPEVKASSAPAALALVGFAAMILRGRRKLPTA